MLFDSMDHEANRATSLAEKTDKTITFQVPSIPGEPFLSIQTKHNRPTSITPLTSHKPRQTQSLNPSNDKYPDKQPP
jgi:hypothetical protein